MKILGINGSPRGSKSRTLRLVNKVLEGAKSVGADVELVDVCKLNIEYCNGCEVCYKKGECTKKDDFQGLYDKILAADGLVMGSPNYIRSITAQMKTLLDRMADTIHCQLLTGKYSVNVATAGGMGQDMTVTEYLNGIMLNFGSFVTGSAGAAMAQGPKALEDAEKRAFDLGIALAEDIRTKRDYAKQREKLEENRKHFMALVKRNREWEHEYEHWNKLNWT
jgi:multimeric flavodoxin WrbA